MTNGTLTLNGITDQELVKILDAKIRHEGSFSFNPQQLQVVAGMNNRTVYNNAILTWQNADTLKLVLQLLTELEGRHRLHPKEAA